MHQHHRRNGSAIGTGAAVATLLVGAPLLAACGVFGSSGEPTDASVDAAAVGSPIAWYRFEGELTDDSSGLGHHAQCGAGCPKGTSNGRMGAAAQFDGKTYLLASDEGSLSTPEGFTAAAWVKLDRIDGRTAVFTKKYLTGPKNSWALTIDADRFPFCFTSTRQSNHALRADRAVQLDRWHHLACSWDGTTKRLYLDGLEVETAEVRTGFDRGPVVIGGDVDNVPDFLIDGLVDEAMLFDYPLEPESIASLADRTLPTDAGSR